MSQTVLTVIIEVQPESANRLIQLISDFDAQQEPVSADEKKFDKLRSAVPSLHFLSMAVFPDDQYNPLFILEANFDGRPGPFWAQIEATMGEALRDMLRCCNPPRDRGAVLFNAVIKQNSRIPVAPLLEACTVLPAVYHQGNRGLDRMRIIDEGKLFDAIQNKLRNNPDVTQGSTAPQIHQNLRRLLLSSFPWLDQPATPRVTRMEGIADQSRWWSFVILLIAGLMLPPFFLAQLSNPVAALLILLIAAGFFILKTPDTSRLLAEKMDAPAFEKVATIGWAIMILGALTCSTALFATHGDDVDAPWVWLVYLSLFLVGVLAEIRGLLYWLRWLECRDSSSDAPRLDEKDMLAMAQREDKITQNHMCSVVHVKPGVLRAVLVRVGLWGLGLYLRHGRQDGYLKSMRTIHFAHWALINNGSRLIFLSNFDGSWESYLDDFIEKAHNGLTLAWAGGVGFPPTEFLVGDGATHGRKFKAWARHSMVESHLWFSAYKEYTVNQIERQARIAEGLRKHTLSDMEAQGWTLDL